MTPHSVSVVVPTHDRSRLLVDTVTSILEQRGPDVEVLIVDDGSSPEHASRIRELGRPPVRVLRNERPRGVAAARNQGMAAARCDWVAFCDDDDLWTPDKLADQLAALRDQDREWAYSGAIKFEHDTLWQVMHPPPPELVRTRLAHKCIIPAGASNVVASRHLLTRVGGFDEDLQHLADWDLWLRLLETGLPAAAPGLAVAYRLHPQAMSLTPAGILDELAVLDVRWRHLRGDRPLDPGPTHLWIAMSELRAGRRARAARSYLRAARHAPRKGLRGLVRSLHPDPPRPAHVLRASDARASRFKPVQVVEVTGAMRRLLDELEQRGAETDHTR